MARFYCCDQCKAPVDTWGLIPNFNFNPGVFVSKVKHQNPIRNEPHSFGEPQQFCSWECVIAFGNKFFQEYVPLGKVDVIITGNVTTEELIKQAFNKGVQTGMEMTNASKN